jgi:rubrerythrin
MRTQTVVEDPMNTSSLVEAIRVVKRNEQIARDRYLEAAKTIGHPRGKELFTQLSNFEQYHYNQISALEKSLVESNDYIDYEGMAFPLPPIFDIKAALDPDRKSVMTIISEAIDLEKTAEKSYADLAAQITVPQGRQMFMRLSEEEHNHYRILNEAYWALNELGIWRWTNI